jgi:ferredoxin-NADP reductase
VLRVDEGLGRSRYIHQELKKGETVNIRGPRNNFALEFARRHLFIAGGIGITPLKPMMEAVENAGGRFSLIYLGKSRASMAFADSLELEYPGKVTIWAKDEKDANMDLTQLTTGDLVELRVYSCGPERLVDCVEDLFSCLPLSNVHVERFSAPPVDRPNGVFRVVLERSGKVLDVSADNSLLDVLLKNGTACPFYLF